MFLKGFLKPKSYNTYWTYGPGHIYQIDLFSLAGLLRHIGFDLEEIGIKKPKGPWVFSCIDMYSRYVETQYVGWINKIELVIVAFMTIIEKMGKPLMVQADNEFNTRAFKDFCNDNDIKFFFRKPYENPKNQLIERANLTIKRFMMKYINKYGWPSSGDLADDAQQVLDACTWYYNRIWHTGINSIPFEVFFGYDDNRQNIVINYYPKIPIGSVVLRKPFRKLSNVPLTVYQVDPEPFTVIAYEGGRHVGKYQLKSLVTDEVESRWYKPYELPLVPENEYRSLFNSPILKQFILSRHGEEGLNQFYTNVNNLRIT